MTTAPKNPFAFPLSIPNEAHDGMTLRDYFAAAALQGMLAYSHVNPMHGNYHENCSVDNAAAVAFHFSEAMLEARNHLHGGPRASTPPEPCVAVSNPTSTLDELAREIKALRQQRDDLFDAVLEDMEAEIRLCETNMSARVRLAMQVIAAVRGIQLP